MARKIFKKSDKSRIRLDLKIRFYYWWLRSSRSEGYDPLSGDSYDSFSGCVNFFGRAYYFRSFYNYGILPACVI